MKNLIKLFTSSMVVVLLFNFNLPAQILNKVNLTGHVYSASSNDSSKTAIANAKVSLISFTMLGDSSKFTDTTDANGRFEIDGILPGTYTLLCSADGYSTLILRQFEVGREKDSVNLYLHNTSQVNGGTISGRVTFQNSDQAVVNALIEFIDISGFNKNTFAATDSTGYYSAKVPAGRYIVSCSVFTADSLYMFHQFYENAHGMFDAKIINVEQGDFISDIDFDIPSHITSKHTVTITGMVQSSLNTPVANATVKAWTSAKSEDESDDNEGKGFVADTKTDANGNFSITLDSISQSMSTFVVAAFKEGYKIQFFNGKDAFYLADMLVALNDTTFSNINFTLTPIDTVQKYSISGTITDTAGIGIKNAFVVAKDSASGKVHIGISDSTGNFTVNNLVSGSYYLMINARGYVPQFYMNASKWENATVVTVDSNLTGINVVLTQSHHWSNSGEIIGEIHSDNGSSLAGVLVTVKDSTGANIGWAITDANGAYTISGVIQGTLTITASSPQYNSQQQNTTYDPSTSNTTVNNFTMSKTVTTVENQPSSVPSRYVLENNYPNPFNPSTIIQFDLPVSSQVRLDIYNVLGQKVAELVNQQLTAGHYNIKFNAVNLSSGVYLYRIEAGNFVSTKKMILSK